MTQVCSSKGKYSTSISQDDLYIAGGFHSTSPLYQSVALVARVTSKLPSALQTLIIIDRRSALSRDQLIIINSSSILSWCFESMKLQGLITDGLPSLSDWPSKTPTSFLEFVVKINLHIKCGYKLEEVNQIGWRHEGTLLCWIWRGAHKKYLIFLIFNVKMY